jgi:hypothetical protein
MQANKRNARISQLAFGDHELNPGGHRLNENLHRADDFGIGRIRNQDPTHAGLLVQSQSQSHQMAELLQEPDPRRPPDPSPAMNNPYAGRSSCSKNISFGTNGAIDPIKYTEHSGKRGASTVFEEGGGPKAPHLPQVPGYFMGLAKNGGGPVPKLNEHMGKRANSDQMKHHLPFNAEAGGLEMAQWHQQRRQNLPAAARRVPATESVVFGANLPQPDALAFPAPPDAPQLGKRAITDTRAARTTVGARELGGMATAEQPNPPPPQVKARKYEDHPGLLHYSETPDCAQGYAQNNDGQYYSHPAYSQPPPPPHISQVQQAMAPGDVPPDAHSDEPKGLPKRHPGPERLRRGRGVDGHGNDHFGRQLATSVVDEVVFDRSPMKGYMPLKEPGANFMLNRQGEFARR